MVIGFEEFLVGFIAVLFRVGFRTRFASSNFFRKKI